MLSTQQPRDWTRQVTTSSPCRVQIERTTQVSEINEPRLRKGLELMRSDEVEQCSGRLRDIYAPDGEVRHCCLGVLTEAAVRDPEFAINAYDREILNEISANTDGIRYDPNEPQNIWKVANGIMTDSVREYYGLPSGNPYLEGAGIASPFQGQDRLEATAANDSAGWTFTEIADAFERTYLNQEDNATPTTD